MSRSIRILLTASLIALTLGIAGQAVTGPARVSADSTAAQFCAANSGGSQTMGECVSALQSSAGLEQICNSIAAFNGGYPFTIHYVDNEGNVFAKLVKNSGQCVAFINQFKPFL